MQGLQDCSFPHALGSAGVQPIHLIPWLLVWISLIPQILTASALLFAPGLLVTVVAGLPPRTAVSLAPAASIGIIAGAGVIAPLVHISWGPVLVAALTGAIVLIAAVMRVPTTRMRGRNASGRTGQAGQADRAPSDRPTPSDALMYVILLGAAALVTTWLVARELNTADAISQTFDAVFHLNAVRWILDTGNASSIKCYLESPQGDVYPMGWHTLVALTMKLTGSTSIPMATNATAIAVSALAWPSGCLALTSRILNRRRLGMVVTALLCSTISAFPLLLLSFGVLYPNFLALSLLPGIIACLPELFPSPDEPSAPPLLLPALLLALGGLGMAQPNVIVTFLIALVIFLTVWVTRAVREARRGGPTALVRRRVITCIVLAPVIIGLYIALRPPERAASWGPNNFTSAVIGEILTSSPQGLPIAWVVAIPAVVGAVAAWRRRRLRWLVVFHAINCALYIVSKTMPMEGATKELRYWLVGSWYSDTFRLAALLPLAAIPLAALGACTIADWAAQRYPVLRLENMRGARRRVAYGVLVAVLVLLGPASLPTSQALHKLESTYIMDAGSPLLTPDELAVIERLPELVGEEEPVAVDPNSGSALAYALAGTNTTAKHIFYHNSPEMEIIGEKLRFAATDPQVCSALDELDVHYVLYFPGRMIRSPRGLRGFESLSAVDGFQLVTQQGRAGLYRITACE